METCSTTLREDSGEVAFGAEDVQTQYVAEAVRGVKYDQRNDTLSGQTEAARRPTLLPLEFTPTKGELLPVSQ